MPEQPNEGLVDEIEDIVRTLLISKTPPDASGDLATMPLCQLLGVYWTWRARFPSPRPRRTHRSRELAASPQAQQHATELAELERKINAGEDLTPHLSERVETAFICEQQRPSAPGRLRDADHDRMLAAWGIHHLHLANTPWRGGFNERGRDLLYAIFRPDDAYLLGVYTHNDWALKGLVEVTARNWPAAGLFMKSNYVPRADCPVHGRGPHAAPPGKHQRGAVRGRRSLLRAAGTRADGGWRVVRCRSPRDGLHGEPSSAAGEP